MFAKIRNVINLRIQLSNDPWLDLKQYISQSRTSSQATTTTGRQETTDHFLITVSQVKRSDITASPL